MRSLERDYRYLLQDLIPHGRLLPERRRSIKRALLAGDERELRREAILSLEELAKVSYLRRESLSLAGDDVRLIYSTTSGSHRFLVTVPSDEWDSLRQDLEGRYREAEAPIAPAPVDETAPLDTLPDLIRSFSINDRNGTILQKLDSLLPRLTQWLGFAHMRLYLISEKIGEAVEQYRFVETISQESLMNDRELSRAIGADGEPTYSEGEAGGGDAVGGAAFVGLKVMGELWGVLRVLSEQLKKSRPRMLTAAGVVEQTIENNIRLEQLISIDKLTRIYNRHFYDIQLPIEIERATRTGTRLSMLLIDIDDFKRINDELGHKKGDEALVTVARLIKENLRKIDLPFRYGGEEFVILLPGTAHMEAIHTAERLRNVIELHSGFLDDEGRSRRITVSVGIAVFPDSAASGEDLFVKADRALLRAKRSGKNRVELEKNHR